MSKFRDSQDREWTISIDAPAIMRIREECDPDFLKYDNSENNTYARLQGDPILLCRVIYVLCEEERTARNLSEKDFYLGVIGNAIDAATDALLQAIRFFIPKRQRMALDAMQKQDEMQQAGLEKVMERLSDPEVREKLMEDVPRRFEELLTSRMTPPKSATDSQDSLESIQGT